MTKYGDSSEAREIINEAVSLMQSSLFSTSKGELLTGRSVRILIDPRWDEQAKLYQLLITCYALGQCPVPWNGMPVRIDAVSEVQAPTFVARLNHRGQALVSGLAQGEYRLSISSCWFSSETPIIEPSGQWEGLPEQLAAAAKPEAMPSLAIPQVYESNDRNVLVTLEKLPTGEIALDFETADETISDAVINFTVFHWPGQAKLNGEVVLIKDAGKQLWRGRWTGSVQINEPCHLMFHIFPGT